MFNLTQQERQVVIFLISVALAGLGINFVLKLNSGIEKLIWADDRLTKININQAGLDELLGMKIITPKLAKSIIEYRNAKGAFRDIQELKEIKGIGDYRYERLKDLLFVE